MSAYLAFPLFLVAAAFGFTAAVVVCAPKGPRPTPPLTEAEIDELIRLGLADWGKDGAA